MKHKIKQLVALIGTAILGNNSIVNANSSIENTENTSPQSHHSNGNDSFLSKLGLPVLGTGQTTRDTRESSKYVGFSSANYQVSEGNKSANITVEGGCSAVNYSSRNGTATEDDYHAVKDTLTFTYGASGNCYNEASIGSFNIPIIDDSVVEDNETIHLTLGNGAEFAQSQAVLTIIDNDISSIGFSHLNYDVEEASELATVTVERTDCVNGKTPPASVEVGSNYGNGTASYFDYRFSFDDNQLSWDANECGEKSFDIEIDDDLIVEDNETISLNLAKPSGASIDQREAILTIVDNDDSVVVGFSKDTYSVKEGEEAKISVEHFGCSSKSPIVSIAYTTSDGTATQEDYVTVNRTLVGGKGVNCGWSFKVPTVDDTVSEDNETVFLKLVDPTGDAKLGIQEAVLTIIDNELTIDFVSESYSSANEQVGEAYVRVESNLCSVSVNYLSRNGTATEDDYQAVAGTLNFLDQSTEGCYSDEPINIPIIDDSLPENSETVHLTFTDPTNGTEIDELMLTIIDNDGSSIGFSKFNYDVDETSKLATITVERTDCIEGFIPQASVNTSISSNKTTAASGSDYNGFYGKQLTWDEGECGEKSFEVEEIIDDSSIEGNETARLELTKPSGANIHQKEAILTIIDNDDSVVIGFSKDTYSVKEGEEATILLDHFGCGYQSPIVSIAYASSDGTATQEDYVTVNGILVGGKDVNCSWRFNVPTIDDNVLEDDETVLLKLAVPTGDAELGVQEAILTIIDNDQDSKEMSVKMDLNQTSYTSGDRLIANLESDGTGMADLYIAIVFPNGDFVTLREFTLDLTELEGWHIKWSVLNTPKPYLSFREAGASIYKWLYPIIDLRLPPNLAVGDYSACGVLIQPDAIDVRYQSNWIDWDCSGFKVYQ